MVAIIHNSGSLRNALHYNENKVRQKSADCIHSGNYPKDTELLSFNDKMHRLQKQIALNQQTRINSVHISLNFDPSDKLTAEKFKEIADTYMQKIGFGEQPYLVYRHHDAGHPHIHLVTTNIKHDGKRIELHNLARNQSMKASKAIEKEFHLVEAESKHLLTYELKPVNILKVQYGKAETRRAITNVLDHVLPVYKYTSLAELNAVLRQYNIMADRGSEDSRIFKSKGLVYRILDGRNQKTGVPIKASLIYSKPTLKNIEARFAGNEAGRQRYKQRLTNAVDFAFMKRSSQTLSELIMTLQKEHIQVMLRQNENGIIYGITYVDHKTKCVFNGSHLGKQYSANAIQQRCAGEQKSTPHPEPLRPSLNNDTDQSLSLQTGLSKLVDDLFQADENLNAGEPSEQKSLNGKERRNNSNHTLKTIYHVHEFRRE